MIRFLSMLHRKFANATRALLLELIGRHEKGISNPPHNIIFTTSPTSAPSYIVILDGVWGNGTLTSSDVNHTAKSTWSPCGCGSGGTLGFLHVCLFGHSTISTSHPSHHLNSPLKKNLLLFVCSSDPPVQ